MVHNAHSRSVRPLPAGAVGRRRRPGALLLARVRSWLQALALVLTLGARAEVVLPPLPTPTLLETDGSTALHTVRLPLALPFGVGLIRVEFDLAFGTRETPAPGAFLDAFSLSFEPPHTDASALLFNADARGERWFPEDPGGVQFPVDGLQRTAIPFAGGDLESWPVLASYAVRLTLPIAWQDCEAGLWLDLFDNQTTPDSFATVRHLRLVARNPFFLLESSATPAGPFSVEMGVVHNADAQRFELRRGGVARFFRLRADSTVRLRVLERSPDLWRFAYEFPEPNPTLESAPQPHGPYTVETNALLDLGQRRFQWTAPAGSARFFRIQAGVRTAVTRLESSGNTHRISFEYRPRIFSLQSSAQPCGPFADDPTARFDTASQVVTVPRTEFTRIFRVTHSDPTEAVRLLGVGGDATRWVLSYDRRPHPTDPAIPTPPREVQP